MMSVAEGVASLPRMSDADGLRWAERAAEHGTCDRARVGCVIARDGVVLVAGWNTAMAGQPACSQAGHMMEHRHCQRAVHAEQMAVAYAARHGVSLDGCTAYVTHAPCSSCVKLLHSAGVSRVIYGLPYTDKFNAILLQMAFPST